MIASRIGARGDRIQGGPDSERGQAVLRIVIVYVLLLYTAWVAARDVDVAGTLWAVNLFGAVFSVALFARIVRAPRASPRRRVLGAIHDNVAATIWLYSSGPIGALGLFIYPFVTVGNGFRFGVRYLAWSGFLGAVGIATLIVAAPGWHPFAVIGAGVLLSHVVVTLYTGVLLRRLQQTRDQLERMATHDVLTALPNRRLFMERLAHVLAARDRRSIACVYLDLDAFKAVNDSWGHRIGDELLRRVADEVRRCVRGADMPARLGGDEFAVILDDVQSPDAAKAVADRIIELVGAIDEIEGRPVRVSASVGIAFLPAGPVETSVEPEELVKAADEAMYAAKGADRGQSRSVTFAAGSFAPTL